VNGTTVHWYGKAPGLEVEEQDGVRSFPNRVLGVHGPTPSQTTACTKIAPRDATMSPAPRLHQPREDPAHGLVVLPVGAVDHHHVLGQVFAQVLWRETLALGMNAPAVKIEEDRTKWSGFGDNPRQTIYDSGSGHGANRRRWFVQEKSMPIAPRQQNQNQSQHQP